jgi:tetratricopeptide (TPR) repeat protein
MFEGKEEIEKWMELRELEKAIKAIHQLKKENPDNKELLFLEAECYNYEQSYGKAINLYNEILTLDPEDELAQAKKEQIQTILKFVNIDIYANPNLNHDPWD